MSCDCECPGVCDKAHLPANLIIASTAALPPAQDGLTVLIQDTGETVIRSCGEWVRCPAKVGRTATNGTQIWLNNGSEWLLFNDLIEELVADVDLTSLASFCQSVQACLPNQDLTITDCDGNSRAGNVAVPTCQEVTAEIAAAVAGTGGGIIGLVASGANLPSGAPADGYLPLYVHTATTPANLYYWTGAAWTLLGDGVGTGTGTGGLTVVTSDESLSGDGTAANPLGVDWTTLLQMLTTAQFQDLCNRLAAIGCDLGGGGAGSTTIIGGNGIDVVTNQNGSVTVAVNCQQLETTCGLSGVPNVYFLECDNSLVMQLYGPPNSTVEIQGRTFNLPASGVTPVNPPLSTGPKQVLSSTGQFLSWVQSPGPCDTTGGGGA